MRAMVYTRPGVVENLEVEEPVVGPDEVLIRVAAAGICGSEIHGIGAPGFRTPPLVMGHEFAGTTPDGQRVVVNPIISCRTCAICTAGQEQLCPGRSIIGIHRPGAFAEHVAVPRAQLHPLPDGVSWLTAALVEPIANGLHAWELTGRPRGARVGIIGSGPIGLACHAAAAEDTDDILVVDVAPERLATASAAGAQTAKALHGEFDVIIDAVGSEATRQTSVSQLRPGGTAVWVGLAGPAPAFDALAFIRQGKRIIGSFAYPDRTFARAVALAARHEPQWAHPFPLDEGATIFMRLVNGDTTIVKAVLQP